MEASELLVGGDVTTVDGAPVPNAVITLCGSRVHADAGGSFELIAAVQERIAVLVSAPGHGQAVVELDLAVAPTSRLSDGTVVVLHDFVLSPESAR